MTDLVDVAYDDAELAAGRIAHLVGQRRFGAIRYRRQDAREIVESSLPQGYALRHVARGPDDRAPIFGDAARVPELACHWPARVAVQSPERARDLLARLALARQFVRIGVGECAITFGDRAQVRAALEGAVLAEPPLALEADGIFCDLGDYPSCLQYLSSANEPRHFNQLSFAPIEVVKRSADVAKVRREARYYALLPEEMRPWFVESYDFAEVAGGAQYRMRRYLVPDMAVQWVHDAVPDGVFEQFLSDVMAFVAGRRRRPAAAGEGEAVARRLYRDKVDARLEQLGKSPHLPQLERLFALARPRDASLAELCKRYYRLLDARWAEVAGVRELAIGHGDLCFSNILYDRESRLLKLVDVAGADVEAELWTHPLYDLAKLSHSVLGDYDWINQDCFDIAVDAGFSLALSVMTPREGAAARKRRFVEVLSRAGYPVGTVRLLEASLFLSMLPLHLDHPRKALAFAIRASEILEELERNDG